jgi:HrpA-like RNA helicase
MKNKILVISGPTGSGESTVTNKIIEKYPIFQRLVLRAWKVIILWPSGGMMKMRSLLARA